MTYRLSEHVVLLCFIIHWFAVSTLPSEGGWQRTTWCHRAHEQKSDSKQSHWEVMMFTRDIKRRRKVSNGRSGKRALIVPPTVFTKHQMWFWTMHLHKLNLDGTVMRIYTCGHAECILSCIKFGFGVCWYFAVDLCSTYKVPECGQYLCLRTVPFLLHSQQPNELCMMCTAWARW